jgi:peptidyl-prolyl cis-trans isomerase D
MLETLRKHSRSIFIYIIFGALILAFILTFGPQGVQSRRGMRGSQSGCGTSNPSAATVNGQEISETSWRWALLLVSNNSPSSQRARRAMVREIVLDQLIVRELFAQRAEDMGLRISDDEVRDRITSGDWYLFGIKRDGKGRYFLPGEQADEKPRFSARLLDQFAKQYDLSSVDRLVEEQKKELLASKVRDLVAAGVRVSPEEVQNRYQLENTKADLEFVSFSTAQARLNVELTAAEIDAYLKAHEADLKAQYDKEPDRWKGRDKEVRVRDIYVKSEKPAPKEGEAAPATPPADPAKAKADAALARLKKGEDFAAVAKSVDPNVTRGGDLGWRPLRGLRLGKPVADAVEKLDKGGMTDVVEVPDGFHIVQVIDKREGDLSFDQVKRDLAEDALRDEKAKTTAKAGADAALAAVKAGKPLDKQFPGEESKAPGPKLQKATGVGRIGGFIPGLGGAPELVKAVFDELPVGEVAPKVYEVGAGDFVVVKVVKRDEPDMQKFQTEKPKLAAEMAEEKAQTVLAEFAASQCRRAKEAGQISYDPGLVEYGDPESGKAPKANYAPCMTLR